MKKIVFALILLLPIVAYASKVYNTSDIAVNQADMTVRAMNGRLLNGEVRRFYENGAVLDIVPFKDGRVEGIAKSFYETGELQSETTYKNGLREGIVKEFYENGKTKSEFPFKNDKEHGTYKLYHPNGKLARSLPFTEGMMDGVEKFYLENGNQWLEVRYSQDIITNGNCLINGKRIKLTDQEIMDWNRGFMPACKE